MPKIKFSHRYRKLEPSGDEVKKAVLLEVFKAKTEDLHPAFIEYDTTYWQFQKETEFGKIYHEKRYKLPKGDIIVLLFKIKHYFCLFTTIRRYTPKKYEYYRKMRGKEFDIIVEEEA